MYLKKETSRSVTAGLFKKYRKICYGWPVQNISEDLLRWSKNIRRSVMAGLFKKVSLCYSSQIQNMEKEIHTWKYTNGVNTHLEIY